MVGAPNEEEKAVVFRASDDSSFVHGAEPLRRRRLRADLTNERRGHLAPLLGFPTSAAVFILSVKFFDAFLLGNDEKARNARQTCKAERHFDFSRKITD